MIGVSSSLVVLEMLDVKGLTQLHGGDLMHLGEVEHLYIDKCKELRYLWERESESWKILVNLRKLEVYGCKKLVSFGEKDVNLGISIESVTEVLLYDCGALESYSCPHSVEMLTINGCNSLASLALSPVQKLPSLIIEEKGFGFMSLVCLTSIDISHCKNLMSFPHELLQILSSLEQLRIYDCPSLDYSFPCGLWPPKLRSLKIGCLNKPISEWSLQNFPNSLVDICLYGQNSGVVSFAVTKDVRNTTASSSFLLPPSLGSLALMDFMDVEPLSEVLQHLICLKSLFISRCPKLRDLPETTSDPSSLRVTVFH